MDVQDPWYSEIAAGRKTVEGRTGPPGKFDARLGKVISISCADGRAVSARVMNVRHYLTLAEYLKAETWGRVAPHTGSAENAAAAYAAVVMDGPEGGPPVQVFGVGRVAARGGVNAVELELV